MTAKSGAKGGDTALRALECLEDLALEKGLDDVSMRDVAKRLGISLAALQYHYPSKSALLDGFVNRTIDAYRDRIGAMAGGGVRRSDLSALVRFCAEETLQMSEHGLLAMIEARSHHDEGARRAMERFMGAYVDVLFDSVVSERPDLSPSDARAAAMMICALLEGLPAAIAAGSGGKGDTEDVLRRVPRVALAILDLAADH